MKTINSIIIIVVFALVTFYGLNIFTFTAKQTGNLDDESNDVISIYNASFADFKETYEQNVSNTNFTQEPDVSWAEQFFKEFAEIKQRFNQFIATINLIYKIPDIIFLSIPVLEIQDLSFYRNVAWFFISASLAIAIFQAIAARRVTKK